MTDDVSEKAQRYLFMHGNRIRELDRLTGIPAWMIAAPVAEESRAYFGSVAPFNEWADSKVKLFDTHERG